MHWCPESLLQHGERSIRQTVYIYIKKHYFFWGGGVRHNRKMISFTVRIQAIWSNKIRIA